MIENEQEGMASPRCPHCGGTLVSISNGDVVLAETDLRRQHAYWCPAGCRGPEPDGTFELFECPACGSHDTVAVPRADGVEELECNSCGTITSLQMVPPP
jgi:transcription elongation factor Elf1